MAIEHLGKRLAGAPNSASALDLLRVRSPLLRYGQDRFRLSPRRTITTQELDAAKGDRERILVLGSGWGGYPLARALDPNKYQVVVISPRSYFVFTPLLASTAVGTLEFRATLEPVRSRRGRLEFFEAWADRLDLDGKKITAESAVLNPRATSAPTVNKDGECDRNTDTLVAQGKRRKELFDLAYDKLAICVGCYSQDFGIGGVKENAFFLKDVMDARKIRKRILSCFELAALPIATEAQKKQLLHFAVVGGGPTGMEFAAELHDFVRQDLKRLYPSLVPHVTITIYDVARKVLGMFASALSDYAVNVYQRDGIRVKTGYHVEELAKGLPTAEPGSPGSDNSSLSGQLDPSCGFTLRTTQDGPVGVGMCVWSTGIMMNPFVKKALSHPWSLSPDTVEGPFGNPFAASVRDRPWTVKTHHRNGAIMTDNTFRVKLMRPRTDGRDGNEEAIVKDVFAIGDVAAIEGVPLPATAQVANQKAAWLAKHLNKGDLQAEAFTYKNMGIMAYLGNFKAILQGDKNVKIKGISGWLVWRAAYLAKTVSWRNRVIIFMYWVLNGIVGRDISRF